MTLFDLSKPLFLVACASVIVGCATTDTSTSDTAAQLFSSSNVTANMSPVENAKPNRLRFRNGPLCLCSDGLQEADILNVRPSPESDN